MKGKWSPLVALGLRLAAFLPALTWRLHVQGSALIIAPAWEHRVLALALLLPLIPAVALIVVAVRRELKLPVVLSLVALTLLGIAGGGALYAREVADASIACPQKDTVRPGWLPDGGVEVTGSGAPEPTNLFFGPR